MTAMRCAMRANELVQLHLQWCVNRALIILSPLYFAFVSHTTRIVGAPQRI